MLGSILVNHLRKVTQLIELLREIGIDKQISLPKVVLLGDQSSGKSSLLQQIVGLDLLPRVSGVVRRRPLELKMNNIPYLKQVFAEFDEVEEEGKKKKFTDFSEVRKVIDDLTKKVCGSQKVIQDIPIVLSLFSGKCPNITIIDLPGIISIPVSDQPQDTYDITKDMALRYIKQPSSIILCVIPANQDMATSQVLKVMKEVDPKGERSICYLIKIDTMNRGNDGIKIEENKEVGKNGWDNVVVSESDYFRCSPIDSTLHTDLLSTQSFTKKLTCIVYQQIKLKIGFIFQQLKNKRVVVEEQLTKLGHANRGQLIDYACKSIQLFMKIYKESINGECFNPISFQISQELCNLYKKQYDKPATLQMSDRDIQRTALSHSSCIATYQSNDAFKALLHHLQKR